MRISIYIILNKLQTPLERKGEEKSVKGKVVMMVKQNRRNIDGNLNINYIINFNLYYIEQTSKITRKKT